VASKEELLRSASEEALAVVRYQMVGWALDFLMEVGEGGVWNDARFTGFGR
jgi:hypothetical protein